MSPENACFHLYLFGIGFPFDFVACLDFIACEHMGRLEHFHAAFVQITVEDKGTTAFRIQSAALGFFLPFFGIAVTVEMDGLARLDVLAYHLQDGFGLVYAVCYQGVYPRLEVDKGFGHSRVQGYHGGGAVGL